MGQRECEETISVAANGPNNQMIQQRTSSVAYSLAECQQLSGKPTTSTSSRGLLFQRGLIHQWSTTEPVACDTNGEPPRFEQPQHHLHAQHSRQHAELRAQQNTYEQVPERIHVLPPEAVTDFLRALN